MDARVIDCTGVGNMMPEGVTSYTRKVCLVGDPAVGKTSLVRRFVIDKYDDSYIMTLGAKVMKKNVILDAEGKKADVTLMIWDVMGQKHFKIIESVAFKHIQAAFIVCDMTRRSTLDNIRYWAEALREVSGKVPLIILVNKIDIANQAELNEQDVQKAAAGFNAQYFMTSAKTGDNVEKAFSTLAKLALKGSIV
ncbi:MAG: GTP-binding protein [Euryarchaeota archaeon]|nr:GTP-binding protein [Euryarchaeota archaeon]